MGVDREAFRVVYAVLARGERLRPSEELLERCIEVAAKNKVLLQFLRVVDARCYERLREEARYRRFLDELRMVEEALGDTSHALIKFRKPVAYVPSDIDILVPRDAVREAVSRLGARGFRVVVTEPYCVTMARGGTVVDLYVYPTVGGVIYLDARELAKHIERVELAGLEIPVLRTYAEVVMTVAHAVYKERIYTLNDYITTRTWLSLEAIELARKLRCLEALGIALAIHELVERRGVALPYRIPLARWVGLVASRALGYGLSRASLPKVVRSLGDPRLGKLLASKIARETY